MNYNAMSLSELRVSKNLWLSFRSAGPTTFDLYSLEERRVGKAIRSTSPGVTVAVNPPLILFYF